MSGKPTDLAIEMWRDLKKETPIAAYVMAALGIVLISCVSMAAICAGLYLHSFHTILSDQNDLSDWTSFVTVMGFASQTFLGLTTLALAIVLSGVFTRKLEQQKSKEQRGRELIRLSEKMVDTEFYIKVMYPAWEVALKWMDDDFPNIDDYRTDVIGAEMRLPKNYSRREIDRPLAENNPRLHPHYQPYDVPFNRKKAVITELSESLAFATWVRFWRNVKFLIDEKLVEKSEARQLFREWYMWWAPFMTEFAAVSVEVMARLKSEYGYSPNQESWESSSVVKIMELHGDFKIEEFCGHEDEKAFKIRIDAISTPIMERIRVAIDASKNEHIDGRFGPVPVR